MRVRIHRTALVFLAALAFLPLATDGGQAECWNGTGSLTSTAVGPVNGDESFFKLPTGPANVMFLLDVSGSMEDWPQCSDGFNTGKCATPWLPTPAVPTAANPISISGTCTPSSNNAALAWMENVTTTATYADPGRRNGLLVDAPPWGEGCTGDRCLFDPGAYYQYNDWGADGSGAWATRRAHDTDPSLPRACTALYNAGLPVNDMNGNPVMLGDACTQCMNQHGFYWYRMRIYNGSGYYTYNTRLMLKGTFLNANPPKFVTARKVVKDMAWLEPSAPRALDQVRLGLTILDSGASSPRKARLIVPLGPDRASAFPPTQLGFRQARQYILSAINYDQSVYTDGATTIIDGSTITAGFFNPVATMTPLGSALFNIGQYFASTGFYNATFGSGYQTTRFNETAVGDVNAPWARTATNQCSVCWLCQNNSVVIVTDGMPNSEISFPTAITGYDNTGYSNAANCGGTTTCGGAALPRVADWLHNQDLRSEGTMTATQKLSVHTVGIGISQATAVKVLQATANLGGGMFQNVEDPVALGNAVMNAINSVLPKQNSFSASSAASLQTVQSSSSYAFLTRFKPNTTVTWEGHVFETFLFDERASGCDVTQPAKQVSCLGHLVDADLDGDGLCNSIFMVDADCDEIGDNTATGALIKKRTGEPANVPWDAGQTLSDPTRPGYRSADETAANARNVFTYLGATKTAFTAANAATLLPYLNIGAPWCTGFLARLGITPAAGQAQLTCAQQLIYFVRGFDTLNQDGDGCWGPGNARNAATCPSGEERDRANDSTVSEKFFWKFGDVFHSSPVVVTAPISEWRCLSGYENQCVAPIYSPMTFLDQTPVDYYDDGHGNRIDAYEAYRQDHLGRKRVLVVGANDGMLHGFDAGDPDTASTVVDFSGATQYTNGDGRELWAFIPPDLLPRLKDLVDAHQYMVDGSPLMRDVWVDGSGREVSGADGRKQKDEFHTVVVFGRRSGGSAWTGLDVTDPTSPTLRWSFPDPSSTTSDDALWVGETWAEFAPKPPPIVPVRLERAADPRGWEERWSVMLPGGYDPTMVRGRAVFLLDVWTGKTLWRYTDADFKRQFGYGANTSMFPVTAGMSLVDIDDANGDMTISDAMFDTATWGDLGGNMFVARLRAPGHVDPGTGRVDNWYVARAFEEQRQTDDVQRVPGRSEFFFATANYFDGSSGLRTFLGSGNRERLMTQGPTCGTDNLWACAQAGCGGVTARSTFRSGSCETSMTFSSVNDVVSFVTTTGGSCPTTTCPSGSGTCMTCAAPAPGAYSALHTVTLNACPGAGTVEPMLGSAYWDGAGLVTVNAMVSREVALSPSLARAQTRSRFYGLRTYGERHAFTDPASAASFERARATDTAAYARPDCTWAVNGSCLLVDTSPAYLTSTAGGYNFNCQGGATKCRAWGNDPGWYYEYGGYCPYGAGTPACNGWTPWRDEKTGASSTVIKGCLLFSSFRPVGATTTTDPCAGNLGSPIANDYLLNPVSGVVDQQVCSAIAATSRSIIAPPTTYIPRLVVSGGTVSMAGMVNDPGSGPRQSLIGSLGSGMAPVYWLELSRDDHACRHVSSASCR